MSNPPDPPRERDSLILRPQTSQEPLTTATPIEPYFKRWRRQAQSDFLDTLQKEATVSGITGIIVILLTIVLFLLGVAPLLTMLPVAVFAVVVLSFYTYYFLRAPAQLDRARQATTDALDERHGIELQALNEKRASEVSTLQAEASALQTNLDKLSANRPNLVFLYAQINFVHLDDKGVIQDGGDGDRTITAIVAKFQNKAEPPRRVSPAKSVIAHINYEVDGRPYEYGVSKGTWINEEYNQVDFEVGDTHRLLIAAVYTIGNTVVNYKNNNDSPDHRRKSNVIPLNGEQFIVEVELVVRENSEAGRKFKFKLTPKSSPPLELIES